MSQHGSQEHLDVNDARVRGEFQHELDFWLKGMYRKKEDPEKASLDKNTTVFGSL